MMTITELRNTIKRMREIYPFEDGKTEIRVVRDLPSGIERRVMITTVDAESGIEITMTRDAVTEDIYNNGGKEG